ncbi:hypothetical protein [Novosphingobium olei]|uniref:Uncharacterized protein n=1 Tax=Novosphingobium olei TaxID=2728851 RepID=A0A7Y0GAS8_9SPHN|nr:hypothetical protein [Novosphingobium olei]NML95556.1 hypothetical protein [Novosphingobium olei]BEU99087.1 hypothetical protein NSDW_01820 [Novosphingobium olei]
MTGNIGRHRRPHAGENSPPSRAPASGDNTLQAILAAMTAALISGGLWALLHSQLPY